LVAEFYVSASSSSHSELTDSVLENEKLEAKKARIQRQLEVLKKKERYLHHFLTKWCSKASRR
jgi:hypothetical protein